jgi:hypothetical protein
MQRKTPYARRYTTMNTEAGPVVVPVVDDLPDDMLQWHYEWGLDNDDYEYAQAVYIEMDKRGIKVLT